MCVCMCVCVCLSFIQLKFRTHYPVRDAMYAGKRMIIFIYERMSIYKDVVWIVDRP